MLVLTRRKNEKVIIDERITITVVRCGDGSVRLGFEAPDDVNIRREELPLEGDESCTPKN
jgi:carbon storage regulator